MGLSQRIQPVLSNPRYTFLFFLCIALVPRIFVWSRIPVDWNSDSYHHWQISYLSLKLGFRQGRLLDLNGCEYYWGMVPHLVQAVLLGLLNTASILPYRLLNLLLGGVNTYLVYVIGRESFNWEVGLYAGLLFAFYPFAAIFDVIAMQETLALTFALISLTYFRTHPGWSGFSLALAAQSRVEYWLVSAIVIVGVVLVERLSPRIQSFFLGWLGVTMVFCTFFYNSTANPFYPLYWSLFSAFGGWKPEGLGLPLHTLMLRWASVKIPAWSMRPAGQAVIASVLGSGGVFIGIIRWRSRRHHLILFFLASVVVFSPLFLPYYPAFMDSMLLMLRMSLPIAASGSILLCAVAFRVRNSLGGRLHRLPIEPILIIVTLLSLSSIIPAYARFQEAPEIYFEVADEAIKYYDGGTIVCDHPTVNYRLVQAWGVRAADLLGNHYAPHYYGMTDPIEWARWFERNNVTLWIYASGRAYPVWTVTSRELPGLLVLRGEVHGVRIYAVDREVLEEALSG